MGKLYVFHGKRENAKFDDVILLPETTWCKDLVCPKSDFQAVLQGLDEIEFVPDEKGDFFLHRNSGRIFESAAVKEEHPFWFFPPSYTLARKKLSFVLFRGMVGQDDKEQKFQRGEWVGEPQIPFSPDAWERLTGIIIPAPTSLDPAPVVRLKPTSK